MGKILRGQIGFKKSTYIVPSSQANSCIGRVLTSDTFNRLRSMKRDTNVTLTVTERDKRDTRDSQKRDVT